MRACGWVGCGSDLTLATRAGENDRLVGLASPLLAHSAYVTILCWTSTGTVVPDPDPDPPPVDEWADGGPEPVPAPVPSRRYPSIASIVGKYT